jgi:hypothetical protein
MLAQNCRRALQLPPACPCTCVPHSAHVAIAAGLLVGLSPCTTIHHAVPAI